MQPYMYQLHISKIHCILRFTIFISKLLLRLTVGCNEQYLILQVKALSSDFVLWYYISIASASVTTKSHSQILQALYNIILTQLWKTIFQMLKLYNAQNKAINQRVNCCACLMHICTTFLCYIRMHTGVHLHSCIPEMRYASSWVPLI